jgi:hypothetical protein
MPKNNFPPPADGRNTHVIATNMDAGLQIPAGAGIGYKCQRLDRLAWRSVMKKATMLGGLFALGAALIAAAQAPSPSQAQAPAAPPAGGGLTILEFKPAMDDLMTMLIQPRHLKLYYAGEAKNWKLADFQLRELRQALARIGRTIPTYRKIGVDDAVASIFTDKAVAVETAIKAADPAKFKAAYTEMTGACNACHAAMEHEFLVIKAPDAMVYPNQEFRP